MIPIALLFMSGPQVLGLGPAVSAHHLGRISSRTITVSDPMDVETCTYGQDCPIDIRFVSKRSYRSGTGQRMLALGVEAYELYGGLLFDANIKLRFDARGGPRPDGFAFMSLTYVGADIGWACGRRRSKGGDVFHVYRIKVHGDRMTCFIPRRDLRPTKPIRFLALSRVDRYVVDRAPDHKWAGGRGVPSTGES